MAIISKISRKRKLSLLLSHLAPKSNVLEIGSGSGWFGAQLSKAGHSVSTLDLFPPADYVGDIKEWRGLGLSEASFDVVVALEVLEHVDCISDIKKLCKPSGLIFLSSPHPNWDWCMKILEFLGLNQKRTSDHINLTNFQTLPLTPVFLKRPAIIHQVALFKNHN